MLNTQINQDSHNQISSNIPYQANPQVENPFQNDLKNDAQIQFDQSKVQNPQSDEIKQQGSPNQQQHSGTCDCLKPEFYYPYFDVNQIDVLQRLKTSVMFWKPLFFEMSRNKPDLWGPFWIYTTLIFMLSVAENFYLYLKAQDKDKYHYAYKDIYIAALLIYCIGFGTPIVLGIIMKCFGSEVSLFQTICLYGYSMAIYVPVIIFCTLPVNWLQWVMLIYATINSTGFMVVNLWSEFAKYQNQRKYIGLGILVGCQAILLFVFKFKFFKLVLSNQ